LFALTCGHNELTSLDVSNNKALQIIDCPDVQLTTLDVSNQPELRILICGNNPLTRLDLSKNPLIGDVDGYWLYDFVLDISNMPTLWRVCVWTMPFPPKVFRLKTDGSPNVYFTQDCN
jgi:hypothetical protein